MGRTEVNGVWSVQCGATLRYPAGTQIVNTTEDHFELTPEEKRALAVEDAMMRALADLDERFADAIRP